MSRGEKDTVTDTSLQTTEICNCTKPSTGVSKVMYPLEDYIRE